MEIQKRKKAGVVLLAFAATLLALSCGGKQSMASKSAAAYREAIAKSIPVGSGEHGGHTAQTSSTSMAGRDHSQMSGMDHSKIQNVSTNTMANMPGMQHGSMAGMSGMDHSKLKGAAAGNMANMPGMQHGSMAGMNNMAGMQRGSSQSMANMPGMQHGSIAGMGNMPGMQHGAAAVAPPPPAPTNSSGIAQLNPAATLKPDAFDQPAAVAVSEASKASAEASKQPDHSKHERE